MSRTKILSLTLSLLLLAAAAQAAPSAAGSVEASARAVTPQEAEQYARTAERPLYGPIRSKDPVVRAQVKRLYQKRNADLDDMYARMAELQTELNETTDPDFRFEITARIGQLRRDFERTSIEAGLEIARLNEDERRIAEFELALDQVTNPEKYRPAPADPALQAERLRRVAAEVTR